MSDETWDNAESNNLSSQQNEAPRLGFGRGRKPTTSNIDEPVNTSTWNSSGSSEANSGFRRNDNSNSGFGSSEGNSGFRRNDNGSSGFGSSGFNSGFRRNDNGSSGFGSSGFSSGSSGFGNQGQFNRSEGGSQSFKSGNDGNSRACYNCNQTGHMSRECPEPRKDTRGGPRPNRGDFHSSGSGRGGFSSGSDDNRNNNFRSGNNGSDAGFSVTVRNNGEQDEGNNSRSFSGWKNSNQSDSSNTRNTQFSSSTTRGGFSNNRGDFHSGVSRDNNRNGGNEFERSGNKENNQFRGNNDRRPEGSGFRSGDDSNRRREVSDDIFDQAGRQGEKPIERYVPPAPPTSQEDIFGAAASKGANFGKYQRAKVRCTPEGSIKPIDIYEQAELGRAVLANIARAHFEEPTSIQRYTIPAIAGKHDLMACAQTGSGKTAAFLLPIISNLLANHSNEIAEKNPTPSPLCLVLSPTRELAVQTEREARKFAYDTPIKSCSAVGGHDMFATSDRLREGCHILSATTGRLKDMVEKGRISLKKVKYFVLDEADRMLDTGFEPDIRKIEELGLTPKEQRITSMFSATFPEDVQRMAKYFLRNDYIFLVVGAMGGANEDIAQTIEEVPKTQKTARLLDLLQNNLNKERCLIFVETKRSADYIGALLSQKKFMSTTMHGDRLQRQRDEAVRQFTDGTCPVLVATSVAARGLDFPLIGYVVNYDLPDTSDFYIHRIGRTGRAGHLGKSISFFDPERESDRRIAPELAAKLSEAGQNVPDFLRNYSEGGAFSAGASRAPPQGRDADMRFRGNNNFGNRNQSAQPTGGSASAGAASETWD